MYEIGHIFYGTQKGRYCEKQIWDGEKKIAIVPLIDNPKSAELPKEIDPFRDNVQLWGVDGLFNLDTYPLIDYIYTDLSPYLSTYKFISEDLRSIIVTVELPDIGIISIFYVKRIDIKNHPNIKDYINGVRKYAKCRSVLVGHYLPSNKSLKIVN